MVVDVVVVFVVYLGDVVGDCCVVLLWYGEVVLGGVYVIVVIGRLGVVLCFVGVVVVAVGGFVGFVC